MCKQTLSTIVCLLLCVPRYQYDPNPKVQEAMSGIWKSLVDDPKAALDAALPTLMQDLTQVGLLFEHNPAVTRRVSGHKQMAWHVTDACLNASAVWQCWSALLKTDLLLYVPPQTLL